MIPAHKFPLGKRLVWRLIDRSFRKYFDRVYFRTSETSTEEQRAALPMIICANHSSWWDGYVIASDRSITGYRWLLDGGREAIAPLFFLHLDRLFLGRPPEHALSLAIAEIRCRFTQRTGTVRTHSYGLALSARRNLPQ